MNRNHLHYRWETEVFIIQEESRPRLIETGKKILQLLPEGTVLESKDLAYFLNCPWKGSNYRLAIVADSLDDFKKKLSFSLQRLEDPQCNQIADRSGIYFFEEPLGSEGSLAFLFPGEGSQYFKMLSDLCIHFPEVRSCFDLADRVFIEEGRDILLSHLLFLPKNTQDLSSDTYEKKLWEINLAVASVFTGDYSLLKLMDHLEIRPQAVLGHSSGEFTALIAAGAMKAENDDELVQIGRDLIRLYTSLEEPTFNARLMTVAVSDPDMLASVMQEKDGDLYIAMDNCPHQVIMCGSDRAIAMASNRLKGQSAICSFLPYDRPYHTPMYRQVSDHFLQFFRNRRIASPHTTLYSCATMQPYPTQPAKIRQLAVDQWSQPVRFRETIEAMYDDGVRIFVEVGPRGNLTGFVEDILGKRRHLALPSNLHIRSGITQINHMVGLLAAHGVNMNLQYLYNRRLPESGSLEEAMHSAEQTGKSDVSVRLNPEVPKIKLSSDTQVIKTQGFGEKQKELQDFSFLKPAQPSENSRSKVMQEYLETMEKFLNMQRELMMDSLYKAGAGREDSKIK